MCFRPVLPFSGVESLLSELCWFGIFSNDMCHDTTLKEPRSVAKADYGVGGPMLASSDKDVATLTSTNCFRGLHSRSGEFVIGESDGLV